ncbi:Protein kintoun [Blattella germanica]|nr:Protein kintoun [Blattella germanica]
MAGRCKDTSWEELEITRDEVERIGEALKKEEFRKLLVEYAEEVNDPENKKQYEKEITELEKERGVEVTFVNPDPCYVIKSSVDGKKKAFINICKNDKVGKPVAEPIIKSGTRGLNWSLPYTQAPPRDDFDKNGNRCAVFDVVFHPDTYHLAENNAQFKNMLNNTAMDAVEDNFNVQLDRKNIKFPKMKYKGAPRPTVIRKKVGNSTVPKDEFSIPDSAYPYKPPLDATEIEARCEEAKKKREEKLKEESNKTKSSYTTPSYVIKHRHSVEVQDFSNDRDAKMNAAIPKDLVVEVQLPLINSCDEMVLDVTEKSISLVSEKPARYKLQISLPYSVDEERGNAKFDKSLRKLMITLPVRRQTTHLIDIGREDSGVESDLGRRTSDSSSDDDVSHQNSVIEIAKTEDSLPEISSNEAYRTMMSVTENKFLKPDVHYMLPAFTCNVMDNVVAFTLHVKNVDPESVEHIFLGENFSGVHIRFTSVGSGFFPIHYAFYLKFLSPTHISEDSLSIEPWDNNVIVQMQLAPCDTSVVEYCAGLEENSAIEALDNNMKTDVKVEVTKYTEDEVTLEVSHERTDSILDEDDDEEPTTPDENGSNTDVNENSQIDTQNASRKCRTMSESSGDELSFSPTKKGILKNNGRVSRSLSESSVDDYVWSSSLDMVTQSGSESCIPEEGTEEERETKKTVRFNEVVSQKTYRTNSSILGQRKKNQRKTRNKRRCQERRASESENSEGEAEKERDKKTDDEEEEEEEEKKENEAPDNIPQKDAISAVQENRVQPQASNQPQSETKSNGRDHQPGVGTKHSPKGKRKNRKGASTSSAAGSGGTEVEFGSDLIFDLDM